ncbi:FAD/NAD(P)-binding protein [Streptomyces sp. NPDC048297]|uniref:FAD/NAD(P)-binding protein n=1 Tax=Streptomyces sp. NPDC048297 TaxID=3365531 RepID=UPI003711603B
MCRAPTSRFELAVIGCGAAAVCLLNGLLETDLPVGRLRLYDGSSGLWRGRAYQRDAPVLRLNSVPGDMSALGSDPEHFDRWLAARDTVNGQSANTFDPYSGARFVPRALYGDYLQYAAEDALTRLRAAGWDVELVPHHVKSVVQSAGKTELLTLDGRRQKADYVVLCVGRGSPSDEYALAGSPRFIADPYPVQQTLGEVEPEASVGVIGSGLTAMDVVLALRESKHRGPITFLSRGGVLPSVRQKPIQYKIRHFTSEGIQRAAGENGITLDTVVRLLRQELETAGEDISAVQMEIESLIGESPVQRLRRQLAEVDTESIALRVLQTAVPSTGPQVWPLLSSEEKLRLLRGSYRAILALCCPMPPATAAKVLDMIEREQLHLSDGIQEIRYNGSSYTAVTTHGTVSCDVVINAVNAPAHKIPPSAASLVDSLIGQGVASYSPAGGLEVDPRTSQLIGDDRPQGRFYALGDLTFGTFFFTFGIPAITDRARDICRDLAFHVSAATAPPPIHLDFSIALHNRNMGSTTLEELA